MKVAIIGAGASGLICAIYARRKGDDVFLFEKNDRVGKKILQTGNGRCNFCNNNLSPSSYNDAKYVERVFQQFDMQKILHFFSELGLFFYCDEEGRYYPWSNMASSVLDVLRYECDRLGVVVRTSADIKEIKKQDNYFYVNGEKFDKTVICSGNEKNDLLKNFSIDWVQQRDGLVALKTDKNDVKGLAGVRAQCVLSMYNDNEIFKQEGELQFKDSGISGICVFNISSIISRKNLKNAVIFADFAPNITNSLLKNKIIDLIMKQKEEPFENVFCGMFHKNLTRIFLNKAKISSQILCRDVNETHIDNLVEIIKKCPFSICGTLGVGQVKIGGYAVSEFDENCMSKKIENLYVVGEALDIDGLCGGYNLAWAWASGAIAGQN